MDSVLKTGLKYIIIDDGSDFDFKSLLLNYDNVISLSKNIGTYKAFEFVLNKVTTPYVTRMDSDDYFTSIPVIFGNYDGYANSLNGRVSIDLNNFLNKPHAGLNGITVKTHILKSVWFSELRYFCDIIIFARLLREYNIVFYNFDNYIYSPRLGNSITGRKNKFKEVQIAKEILYKENNYYIS